MEALMTERRSPAERALGRVEKVLRSAPRDKAERTVMSGQVPEDLATDTQRTLGLWANEFEELEAARWQVSQDLRFEHMDRRAIEDATWRLVCQASIDRGASHVAQFVADHALTPMELTCFFPVELLAVTTETEAFGVTLYPPDAVALPEPLIGPDPRPERGVGRSNRPGRALKHPLVPFAEARRQGAGAPIVETSITKR
jgi:hypothetical protein